MARHASGLAILVLVLALGCGNSPKGAAAPGAAGDCEPGRCMEDISGRIDDHRPEARACYEAGYARDPTLAGTVVINFEIDPAGVVVDAAQSTRDGQLLDDRVIDCITGVIRQITFAKSPRGKSARAFHRYEFSPP